jgi:hypothetical protein
MGPDNTNVDLATGLLYDSSGNPIANPIATADNNSLNYYDLGNWQQVPKAELTPSTDDNGHSTSGSASGAAVGGIVVLNEVHGGAYAIVQNSTLKSASLSVTSADDENIDATIDATATASGGSSFSSSGGSGSGTTLAVNGSIAINEILGDADAHVLDSSITTTSGGDGEQFGRHDGRRRRHHGGQHHRRGV